MERSHPEAREEVIGLQVKCSPVLRKESESEQRLALKERGCPTMSAMSPFTETSEQLPALKRKRNPTTAAIIGFCFGGIGLGIYFASFIDFIIPIMIAIGMLTVLSQVGWLGGAIVAALWGYFRAVSSNEKLDHTRR